MPIQNNDNDSAPLISVIMGIYNCADTLKSALDCIVNQTYKHWNVIMCDDCSKDNTVEIANKYVTRYPERFKLLINDKNQGLNYSLNRCLKEASGQYIARMDGDDLCDLLRFEHEMEMMISHPEFAIVSCDMAFFDSNGIWGRTHHKEKPEPKDFIYCSQFCHAASIVSVDALRAVGGYSIDKKLLRVEDYHLWIKMYAAGYRGVNIPDVLYQMRDDRNAQRRRTLQNRLNECYVRHLAIKLLKLPLYNYIFCLRPLILALMPSCLYAFLHKRKNS